ncbi:hypothetical protein HPC49_04710 [Pyxidicoccus fallax]|uniref:DUF885 domain-containing protein n=1 Tax=Pyxidicoccus fallax TaxID=394095 RepID=A0A848LHL1_9BACT|nr:hypothetical protein [Pyxidicoccus fallax]NMO16811.1 hypothetical protein [Pyxidicoccus fallax]NPC77552.1 hypothetical protein [Pyxidicoccus fallax]
MLTSLRRLSVLAFTSLVLACATRGATSSSQPSTETPMTTPSPLDSSAEQYVKLVLAVGQHDGNYVDAYYGPEDWKKEAEATKLPLPEIASRAAALVKSVEAVPEPSETLLAMRRRFLLTQLSALAARVRMLSGERLKFDEESQALYDAKDPGHTEAEFEAMISELEKLVPGSGPLGERLERFRKDFVIPKDKLDPVFRAAIEEARRRTLKHVTLPAHETFTLEYVTQKPWGGYNWFKGNATSLIQINTDLPIFILRAIDLAAHEGYPGHHVYNALLEQHLVRERGWVEFTVYPLFSPMSLIAEGSANYGIDVAFPDAEAYLRDVLFPLAGLDPKRAANYVRVEELAAKLSYVGNEAARRYLDGSMSREAARDWLVRYGLVSPERATQRMSFIDTYRAYVINYNLGQDMVKQYVERHAGPGASPERRWQVFRELLSSPRLPSDLR